MADVDLIVVAVGSEYLRYADELFESAIEHFVPSDHTHYHLLPARSGWPDATLYRYHVLLEHEAVLLGDYLFLVDADMRFEAEVGPEVLGELVAVRHPGFVGRPLQALPYERRPESTAFVTSKRGGTYYAGGFVGGERDRFLELARTIKAQIDIDDGRGVIAQWHDESHLNRCLIDMPPTVDLSPTYCHPDDDSGYLATWPESYARKLVALDKSPAERGKR